MRTYTRRLLALSTLLVPLAVTPAAAQSAPVPDPGAAGLSRKVRPGDRLTVTTRDLARIRGKLIAVQDDNLLLATETGQLRVPFESLERVGRQRRGMILGPIIGAGVGVGFAIPLSMLFANEGADATAEAAMIVGLGAGIGLIFDALIDLPRTVYRRDRAARVAIAPQVGQGRGGLAMLVTF
jgi:hypothetical protein